MAPETLHFLEAVVFDRPVMVTPEHARMVMEVYMAADVCGDRRAGPAAARAGRRKAHGLTGGTR